MPFIRTDAQTLTYFPDMVAVVADKLRAARTMLTHYTNAQRDGDTAAADRYRRNGKMWFSEGFLAFARVAERASRDELNPAEAIDYTARMEALNTEIGELWAILHPKDQP